MKNREVAQFISEKTETILQEHCWSLEESNDWNTHSLIFYKKERHVWNCIEILLEEDLEECSAAFGFSATTYYPRFEEILNPILVQNNLVASDYNNDIPCTSFDHQEHFKNTLPKSGFRIASQIHLEQLNDLLHKFINEDALPSFENWNTIASLYNFIQNKSAEDLHVILGPFAPMKKAVIYRLCNDPRGLIVINEFHEQQKRLCAQDPQNKNNSRLYNASKELKINLEKTTPILN
ncbi:hypothetical protein ACFSX9_11810 [Flavobacterium ardleyense]|uniref:Uncharacterized protein n=1 Tax=Flavobacterium ardleyense TaxID=2038737 RepID=A0ABW5Z9A9_9FLAO